jgi:hypothetical protein
MMLSEDISNPELTITEAKYTTDRNKLMPATRRLSVTLSTDTGLKPKDLHVESSGIHRGDEHQARGIN